MKFYDGNKWHPAEDLQIYVRSMGKALAITTAIVGDEKANEYMAINDDEAVVACVGPLVLLADKYDKGE